MGFLEPEDFLKKEVFPGVTIRVVHGERMTFMFLAFAPRSVLKTHRHPHEQIGHVLEGAFELTIGDEKRAVKAGDSYLIPPDVPHGAVSGDLPAKVMDVFSPVREDYK